MIKELQATPQKQLELIAHIKQNKQWIINKYNYLMRDVMRSSTTIMKKGSREIRVPCLVQDSSNFSKMPKSCQAASLWTRTLDHFDREFTLSDDNEVKILEFVKEIIK